MNAKRWLGVSAKYRLNIGRGWRDEPWNRPRQNFNLFLSLQCRRLASYEVTEVIARVGGLRSEEGAVHSAQQSVLTPGSQGVDSGQSPSTSEDDYLMSWSVL